MIVNKKRVGEDLQAHKDRPSVIPISATCDNT